MDFDKLLNRYDKKNNKKIISFSTFCRLEI